MLTFARPLRLLQATALASLLAMTALPCRADEPPDGPTSSEASAPTWLWLLPPAGLFIGLYIGARARRHRRPADRR